MMRFPSLAAHSTLEPGRAYLRIAGGQASTALARTTALDLAAAGPVLLVSPASTTHAEVDEHLSRIDGGAPLPAGLHGCSDDDLDQVTTHLDLLESQHGPTALVLERAEQFPAAAHGVVGRKVADLVMERCRTNRTTVLHWRASHRLSITGVPSTASSSVPPSIRFLTSEILELKRGVAGSVEVTFLKTHAGAPFKKVLLGFEDGLLGELVADVADVVPLLRQFEDGRRLLATTLEGADPVALGVLEPGWLSSLESLRAALEQFSPEHA